MQLRAQVGFEGNWFSTSSVKIFLSRNKGHTCHHAHEMSYKNKINEHYVMMMCFLTIEHVLGWFMFNAEHLRLYKVNH